MVDEHHTSSACRPIDPTASILGFAHLAEVDQKFDLAEHQYGAAYSVGELSTKVGERVEGAVAAFASFTEKRPLVAVIDVMLWFVMQRFQWIGARQIEIQDKDYVVGIYMPAHVSCCVSASYGAEITLREACFPLRFMMTASKTRFAKASVFSRAVLPLLIEEKKEKGCAENTLASRSVFSAPSDDDDDCE